MKATRPTPGNNNLQPSGPKLRNINDKGADIIPDEKPEGADNRLKLAAAVMLLFILVVGIKGHFTTAGLRRQLEENNAQLTAITAEALLLGITADEDGDLVVPEPEGPKNVQEISWDSVEERNTEIIKSFTKTLLTWNGNNEYNKQRQYLMEYWKFTEDSRLLSTFMPPLEDGEILEGRMSCPVDPTIFILENNGKDQPMTNFVICTVRKQVGETKADGTVGIQLTINADGTISNVTAQTLSQKEPKK